jgi:hypothetical protein
VNNADRMIQANRQIFAPVLRPADSIPDAGTSKPAASDMWLKARLAELEETFPEPVIGATAELEAFRAERQ